MTEIVGDVRAKAISNSKVYYKAEMPVPSTILDGIEGIVVTSVHGTSALYCCLQLQQVLRQLGWTKTIKFWDAENDVYYTYEGESNG